MMEARSKLLHQSKKSVDQTLTPIRPLHLATLRTLILS